MATKQRVVGISLKQQKKSVVKRVTKKAVTSVSLPRKIKIKEVAQAVSTTKKLTRTRAVKRTTLNTSSVPVGEPAVMVQLPSNMSQRAIEKSKVFIDEFERYFDKAMYRIAYVSAFCFILLGTSYAAAGLFDFPFVAQKAAIIETTTTTDPDDLDETNTSGTILTTDNYKSEFNFISIIPQNITEPVPVYFFVSNASQVTAKLIRTDQSFYLVLPVENLSSTNYRVIIPKENLLPDYYELHIRVTPLDGSLQYMRSSSLFFMGSADEEYVFNHPETNSTDPNETSDTTNITGTTETVNSDVNTDDETVLTIEEEEEKEEEEEAEEPETQDEDIEEIVTISTTEPKPVSPINTTTPVFLISSPGGYRLTETATLRLSAPKELTYAELYARPVDALSARFVALATKRLDQLVFTFDTKNIPNGEYEFFAKAKYNEKNLVSSSLKLSVKNSFATSEPIISISATPKESEERTFVTTPDEIFEQTTTVQSDVSTQTNNLIKENQIDLKELFQRYAVAKQTGDESLIQAAKKALDEKREMIVLGTMQDKQMRDISDKINSELSDKILDLQNRVDTFEILRKDRSTGDTARDTDSDGISDLDETKLYNTDPTLADTDNDGVTDGIEIMRGYDPLNDTAEAIIAFESPKESLGLVRNDVLQVNEIISLVRESEEEQPAKVAAEIRGRGLPNSYVTLYIFSTPVVVTVRTDADGVFIYTFDKELEDGQHDVYVAVTDNVGDIIAQSNPFSFIKEAQAFTPVAAAEAEVVTPVPVTENAGSAYNLAVGASILAFGLILLMLGISLRGKEQQGKIIITEKKKGNQEALLKVAEGRTATNETNVT